jgi:hypothetical protein
MVSQNNTRGTIRDEANVKYLLLIYTDPQSQSGAPEEAVREMYRAFGAYTAELSEAGILGPAEELQPPDQARSVRVRDGRTVVTDGPFAEVREQLGGFYVIDVPDMATAISWAARIPSAPFGTIEVRPLATGPSPDPA